MRREDVCGRISSRGWILSIVAVLIAALGMVLATHATPSTPTVLAQGAEPCEGDDCSIDCTILTDAWYGEDAQWLIVHAIPRLEQTTTDIVWKPATSNDWPILTVVADWYDGSGSYHSATMTINEDGDCVDTDNPDGYIRCHKPDGTTPPALCDAYGGDWERVASAGAGGCLDEVIYGFDFLNSIEKGGKFYCWSAVHLTAGNNTGLYGRLTCASSPLTWRTHGTA
jgi:hypothetical protein